MHVFKPGLGFLLGVALTTSPALAQEEPISQTVKLADLDLSTRAGRQRLHYRLAAAAYAVCGDQWQAMALDDFMAIHTCVHDVRTSTARQIAARLAKPVRTASSR